MKQKLAAVLVVLLAVVIGYTELAFGGKGNGQNRKTQIRIIDWACEKLKVVAGKMSLAWNVREEGYGKAEDGLGASPLSQS